MADSVLDFNYMPSYLFALGSAIGLTSSALSIFGSSTIIFLILRYQRHKQSIFQKLMLGLSLSDLMSSVAIFLSPFAMPSDTDLPTAFGNALTCQMDALVVFYAYVSFFYSSVISFYFLLVIRYGWSERSAQRRLGCWMPLVPWVLPTYTQVLAICYKTHRKDPLLGVCVIDCPRDDDGHFPIDCSVMRFVLDPTLKGAFFAALVGIGCIFTVFRTVYRQESTTNRQSVGNLKQSKAVARQALCYLVAGLNPVIIPIASQIGRGYFVDEMALSDHPQYAAFSIFIYLFFPIQGFLNWIIYCRPSYTRWRKLCPDKSRLWAYQQVLAGRPSLRSSLPMKQGHRQATAPRTTVVQSESLHRPVDDPSSSNGLKVTAPDHLQTGPDRDATPLALIDLAESNDSSVVVGSSPSAAAPEDDDADDEFLRMDISLQMIMGWSAEGEFSDVDNNAETLQRQQIRRSFHIQRTTEFSRQVGFASAEFRRSVP